MPKGFDSRGTTASNLTPSKRRNVLAAFAGTAVVSLTAASTALARAAAAPVAGPDQQLIEVCEELCRRREAWNALLRNRRTLDDEKRTEDELDRLLAAWSDAAGRVYEAPYPKTLDGAVALARASLMLAERERDGAITYRSDAQSFASWVAEFLVGEEEAAHENWAE